MEREVYKNSLYLKGCVVNISTGQFLSNNCKLSRNHFDVLVNETTAILKDKGIPNDKVSHNFPNY